MRHKVKERRKLELEQPDLSLSIPGKRGGESYYYPDSTSPDQSKKGIFIKAPLSVK
jgi:hypothetical protein